MPKHSDSRESSQENSVVESSVVDNSDVENSNIISESTSEEEREAASEQIEDGFSCLGLSDGFVSTLSKLGYQKPTAIQSEAIPVLLDGLDLIGQAKTGTGKTAAFALPLLSRLDLEEKSPQVLVLAPTRELAIQVSESFRAYSEGMEGFKVLAIYGGQSMQNQIQGLKRGPQVVVGTPGRIMDHMRRKTLKLRDIEAVVLDEADEMLKMGFIEDVEWILEKTPEERQVALFSATMPKQIKAVAQRYLKDAKHIKIQSKTSTVESINQKFVSVAPSQKVDALSRVLELEEYEAAIVFAQTKSATVEIAEALERQGHRCAAMNGDLAQSLRERIIGRLKKGDLNIVVATDVAARGLDVERISHVINYDIPYDTESYVHRIGRTGRAGREGTAILFISNRERRALKNIERATKQSITEISLPDSKAISRRRIEKFKSETLKNVERSDLDYYAAVIDEMTSEGELTHRDIAAMLCYQAQRKNPFKVSELKPARDPKKMNRNERRRGIREDRQRRNSRKRNDERRGSRGRDDRKPRQEAGMVSYRIEVGRNHGVKPGGIVAAIAERTGMPGKVIGRIRLHDRYSTVDLPENMTKTVFQKLKNATVHNKPMKIREV